MTILPVREPFQRLFVTIDHPFCHVDMRSVNTHQLSLFPFEADPTSEATYFIIISPDETVKEAVRSSKKSLNEQIPLADFNLHSIAHISLLKFRSIEDDGRVINKIKQALSSFPCFKINLSGNTILQHGNISKTLAIKINNPAPIALLHTLLLAAFKIKPRKKITPHITIARIIPRDEFNKIDLSAFDHHHSFLCQQITVLKKKPGEPHYDVLAELPLDK